MTAATITAILTNMTGAPSYVPPVSMHQLGRRAYRAGWDYEACITDALVRKHFEGDQEAAKRWWGAIGAWASDVAAGYAGTWMQAFHHPGPPHEFLERLEHERRYALDFTLDELGELAF